MASSNLRSKIQEDHLTCTICYNLFTRPKALPCLHTFCEHCLREYVSSRGYETDGEFPCPICRKTIQIPLGGIQDFTDNHIVRSLCETVDQDNGPEKPTPKPRRSLQPKTDDAFSASQSSQSPPPPYSMIFTGTSDHANTTCGIIQTPAVSATQHSQIAYPPIGFVLPDSTTGCVGGNADLTLRPVSVTSAPSPASYPSGSLYPSVPPFSLESSSSACSEGLILKFGKKGADITDFHKPFGLAVSKTGDFVVTDMGGNRIFIFRNDGELKKRLTCECPIKDVAVNDRNELLVTVKKQGAGFRCYDLTGRCLGEHGKFSIYEETQGIAPLLSGGLVISETKNHSVHILTNQYKMSTKIGRKGKGDGYFQSPSFVATDSKDNIIVSDEVNHYVQVFNAHGKFKLRFGSEGSRSGQLSQPKGICTDVDNNIIIADSGNYRVEMFSSHGQYIRTIVKETNKLGVDVKPINVAMTPQGNVSVLLTGPYFAEVRVYRPHHSSPAVPSVKDSTTWYFVN